MNRFPGQITLLKAKARQAYLKYHKIHDGMSCGCGLGETISPAMHKAKVAFNEAMDSLAKIDPATPKGRL